MTRVMVAAWVGAGNLGDELILSATLRLLRERGCEPLVASLSPDRTAVMHDVDSVGHLDMPSLTRALRATDLLVFGGGGLVQDRTSPWSPIYQSMRPLLARLSHVPIAGLGLGAEPLRWWSSRWSYRRALGSALVLAARDDASASILKGLGLPGVERTADLALTLPPPRQKPSDRIVVCVRSQPQPRALLPGWWSDSGEASPPLQSALSGALRQLSSEAGLPMTFVALEPRRDLPLARRLASTCGSRSEVFVPESPLATLQAFAASRLVVSTRFHGGIAAAISGRPTVLISYAPKLWSLGRDLGDRGAVTTNDAEGLASLPALAMGLLGAKVDGPGAPSGLLERARQNGALLDRALARAI